MAVAVKLAHGDDIRRISLPAPLTFEAVAGAVKHHFHLPRRGARLTYVDADGDAVAIFDDDSLTFALDTAGAGKTLKITVTAVDRERGRKASPAPAAPAPAPAFSPPTATLPGTWAGGAFYPAAAAPPPPPTPVVPSVPFFGLPLFPNPPTAAPIAPPAPAGATIAAPPGFAVTGEELAGMRNRVAAFLAAEPSPLTLHLARAQLMASVGPSLVPFAVAHAPQFLAGTAGHLAILADAVRANLVLPAVAAAFAAYPRLGELRGEVAAFLARCGYAPDAVAAALPAAPPAPAAAAAAPPASFADVMAGVAAALQGAAGPAEGMWREVMAACGAGAGAGCPVAPPATEAVAVHTGVTCDGCGVSPLIGARFKCSVCEDYDLCATCEARNAEAGCVHDATHPFLKIARTEQTPAAIVTVVRDDHEAGLPHGSRFGHGHGHGGRWHGGGGGGRGRAFFRSMFAGAGPAAAAASGSEGEREEAGHGGRGRCGAPWRGRGCAGSETRRKWEEAVAADLRIPTPPSPAVAVAVATSDAAAASGMSAEEVEEARLLEVAVRESLALTAATAAAATAPVAAPAPPAVPAAAGAGAGAGEESAAAAPSAKFVAHVTHADQEVLRPGARFIKAWRMRNDGEAAWPAGTHLMLVGGDDMGAPARVEVPAAEAGACVDIAVPLIAPTKPGRYQTYFRLACPAGGRARSHRFGHRVWADVFVEGGESPVAPEAAAAEVAAAPPTPVGAEAPAVSAGGAVVAPRFVVAADGNSNAAAVLAAMAAADPAPVAPTAPPAAVASAPIPAPWLAATVAPALAPAPVPVSPWAAQLEALASMGFADAAVNGELLARHDGNLMVVINALVERTGV